METPNNITITCANGVNAHLLELEQHSAYRGLLDGGPTHTINEQLLDSITGYQGRIPIHLVRPTERVVETKHVGHHGAIMYMPHRRCTGLFEVGTRWLYIVWFQEDWAPPMDSAVLEELRTLDFMAIAFDEISAW